MPELRKTPRRGGQGRCAACESPDQEQLDKELRSGIALNRLAKRYGISRAALRAHRLNHITPALVALRTERITNGVRKVADRIEEDLVLHTALILDAARRSRNMFMALKAIREQRANFELLARITGELDERAQVTVNLETTQEWIQIRQVVLEFIPPARREEFARRLELLDGGNS